MKKTIISFFVGYFTIVSGPISVTNNYIVIPYQIRDSDNKDEIIEDSTYSVSYQNDKSSTSENRTSIAKQLFYDFASARMTSIRFLKSDTSLISAMLNGMRIDEQ